jgi:maltose O-acetyltransferase
MKTEKRKMIDGELFIGGFGFSKDRDEDLKNLLHRLNVTEYRITKKAREIIKELIPNAGANHILNLPL